MSGRQQEHHGCEHAERRRRRHGGLQPVAVGEETGQQWPRRETDQVLRECEDSARGGTQAGVRDVHDDGGDRPDGPDHHQAARDQHCVLGRARGEEGEGRAQQCGRQDRRDRRHEETGIGPAHGQPVGDDTPDHGADPAAQHDEARLQAGVVGRESIETIEVARQPRVDGRCGQELQAGADAGDGCGSRPEQLRRHGAKA